MSEANKSKCCNVEVERENLDWIPGENPQGFAIAKFRYFCPKCNTRVNYKGEIIPEKPIEANKEIIDEFRKDWEPWIHRGGFELWLTEVLERVREDVEQELRKNIHKETVTLTYNFLEQDPELWKHKIEDNLNLTASIGFQKGKEQERSRILGIIDDFAKTCKDIPLVKEVLNDLKNKI